MKKLLFITSIFIVLSLTISASLKEIEQAIFDSRPEKLEQLLNKATLNEQEIKNFVILAEQRHKMRTSVWRENPQPGEPYAIAGTVTLMPSAIMLLVYLITSLEPRTSFDSKKSLKDEKINPFTILKNKIFNPFTAILSSLLAFSAGSFYLAYKENKKPGWRSKSDEEWDAFKVKLVLLNYIQQNQKFTANQ